MIRFLLSVIFALAVAGCSSSRTYDVSIRNELDKPVTLWLTKDGGPSEEKWRAPEELASMKKIDDKVIAGVVVQPGKTASTGPVEGKFNSGTHAILRVYVGETTMAGILKQHNGRIDLKLEPGVNQFVLRDKNGQPVVDPLKP